jgi:hypothetical protein
VYVCDGCVWRVLKLSESNSAMEIKRRMEAQKKKKDVRLYRRTYHFVDSRQTRRCVVPPWTHGTRITPTHHVHGISISGQDRPKQDRRQIAELHHPLRWLPDPSPALTYAAHGERQNALE